ncbi:MAG: AAA family ATPase [Thermovenabulum sp.]|uniref:ATP-binding protein n=1 Tax=Thermovenabulum sp. TaxID=3100335 RepID=UPI003C7AA3D8
MKIVYEIISFIILIFVIHAILSTVHFLLDLYEIYTKPFKTKILNMFNIKQKGKHKHKEESKNAGTNNATAPVATNRITNAFNFLIGVDEAVEKIKDALELPIIYPEKVKEYRIKPAKGILLYGPPGTGKTSIAKATALYFGCTFIYLKASDLLSSRVGESEKNLSKYFEYARANKPAIIFIDEIDTIGMKRDGMNINRASDILLNTLLVEMDGLISNEGIFVIAATNRPDILDEALTRPGRFDHKVELKLPNRESREKLFVLYLSKRPLAETIDARYLSRVTEGFSPADIRAVCENAAVKALKREIKNTAEKGIKMEDIIEEINKIRGSL